MQHFCWGEFAPHRVAAAVIGAGEAAWESWRRRYEMADVPTLPLRSGSKQPVLDGWQRTASELQWGRAAQLGLDRGNLGVLCDPRKAAVIDADDKNSPGTSERVTAILAGLGLEPPRVLTASGGRHFYLRIKRAPSSLNFGLLPPDVGAGEARLRNCFVVAPPSLVDETRYTFEFGSPEALQQLPAVQWADLAALHPTTLLATERLDVLPVRLVRRDAPGSALELLALLRTARRGQRIRSYRTRSEVEAAVVTALASAGWGYSEIEALFETWQPGHYRDACKHAEAHPASEFCPSRRRYLWRTWAKVLGYLAGTPERAVLADWYQRALALPWPGRTGALEQAVYLGVAAIGWQFSSFDVYASLRDIAEHAGASVQGVSNAIRRLNERGLLIALGRAAPPHSTKQYQISEPQTHQQRAGRETTHTCELCPSFPHAPGMSAFASVSGELWGQDALGRSAGLVYARLDAAPRSIKELSVLTGKNRDTVSDALRRLATENLAAKSSQGWIVGPAKLGDVAQQHGVDGKARLRRERHQRQREAYQQGVAEGRIHPGRLSERQEVLRRRNGRRWLGKER